MRDGTLSKRLNSLLDSIRGGRQFLERLAVRTAGRVFFLRIDEIDWIEAEGNYLRLHCGKESHLIREKMNLLEKRLDPGKFLRIHRSTIVNNACSKNHTIVEDLYRGMPAGRLVRVMELGLSKSRGVTCVHCHVPDQWEKEDKPTKQIAREMFAMVQTINSDSLKKIKNLKGPNPSVNCTTCHRGQVKPALNMP